MSYEELIALVNEREVRVCGVDIGKSGAIVANSGGQVYLAKMPEDTEVRVKIIKNAAPDIVYAEAVHTWRGQGIVSNGSLMEQKGFIHGVASALQIPIKWVEPLRWMECFTIKRTKHFDTTRQWKGHLAEIAKEFSPDYLLDVINRETADAYLMWFWASCIEVGKPLPKKGSKLQF